jgi:large subunit ribosomal protein L5
MVKPRSKSAPQNTQNEESKARLEELYVSKLRPELLKTLNLSNIMLAPKLRKIVLNVGVKEAVADSRVIQTVMQTLASIAGQTPVKTLAKKSIAGFKIREGMPLGVCVTLRRKKMYEFLDKLINLALPKVRDFQGVPAKFDGRGNYNLGIKEWNIFPEAESNAEKTFGMNITIHTSAQNDAAGFELLKSFNMPFVKKS